MTSTAHNAEGAPDSGAPALLARHFSKSFGGARALDDVTLSVGPGEVHGLLGQNGIKEPSGETAPEVLGKGERVRTLEALLITPALVSTACT